VAVHHAHATGQAGDAREIRPAPLRFSAAGVAAYTAAGIALAIHAAGTWGRGEPLVTALGTLLALALATAVGLIHRRIVRLVAGDGALIYSGWTSRVIATRAQPGRLVVTTWRGRRGSHRVALWTDADGRTLRACVLPAWDEAELRGLAAEIGAEIEAVEDDPTAAELRCRYPRSLGWWVAHPVWATVFAIGATSLVYALLSA
jgi:hypothetical protein